MVDWKQTYAAIWRPRQGYLRPVSQLDSVQWGQLLGIEPQKQQLLDNTLRFLAGKPANNALLWGARGTGKSALIKALLNALHDQGLRIIQVDRQDLLDLPEIIDEIRDLAFSFIVFCDDLSFSSDDQQYKALKTVLEGSIERPPDNVLLYATSNRRHLLPESMQDNLESRIVNGELHYADAIEEKISLADRFGLWLSFYTPSQLTYLAIVDDYFPNYAGDKQHVHEQALAFAQTRAAKSGRTAKQFFQSFDQEK